MSDNRYPESSGGGLVFLACIVFVVLYSYFIIYDAAGNFKECDEAKYQYQSICIPKGVSHE